MLKWLSDMWNGLNTPYASEHEKETAIKHTASLSASEFKEAVEELRKDEDFELRKSLAQVTSDLEPRLLAIIDLHGELRRFPIVVSNDLYDRTFSYWSKRGVFLLHEGDTKYSLYVSYTRNGDQSTDFGRKLEALAAHMRELGLHENIDICGRFYPIDNRTRPVYDTVVLAVDTMSARKAFFENAVWLNPHISLFMDGRIGQSTAMCYAFDPRNVVHSKAYKGGMYEDVDLTAATSCHGPQSLEATAQTTAAMLTWLYVQAKTNKLTCNEVILQFADWSVVRSAF